MNIQFGSSSEYRDFLMNCGLGLSVSTHHGDGRWRKLKQIADHISDDLSLDDDQLDLMTEDDLCRLWQ